MNWLIELLHKPWPWYVAGPLIGLCVPALLIAGNKTLGISSTLKQLGAMCSPFEVKASQYDWKKDKWNLFFVLGVLLGGFIAGYVFANPEPVKVSAKTVDMFNQWNIHQSNSLLPADIFSWHKLLTLTGWIILVGGGFLVGFGTRYAGGCTSGHGIMGLSSLQIPSLLATISFFIGGIITSWLLLPLLLNH